MWIVVSAFALASMSELGRRGMIRRELALPSDDTPAARAFRESSCSPSSSSSSAARVAVVSNATVGAYLASRDYEVVVGNDAVKLWMDVSVPLLVWVDDDEISALVKRHRVSTFVVGVDATVDGATFKTPWDMDEGLEGLVRLHDAYLQDMKEDEQLPTSDPAVDALGPERVELVDEAYIERCLSNFVAVDDGGDEGLDRRRAKGVKLRVLPPGAVTPEWRRKDAVRGSCDVHGEDSATKILLLHGGANVCYSPAAYRPLASRLAVLTGMTVVVPDYRLAPEFQYPAALDDAQQALEWIDAEKVFLVGDSSGAALALTLALYRKQQVAGVLCFSAWLDMAARTPAYANRAWNGTFGDCIYNTGDSELERRDTRRLARSYWGDDMDPYDPNVHPLYAKSLANLPPLYMIVGDGEVCRDDTTIFARRARKAGVDVALDIWPRLWHVFVMYSEGTHLGKPLIEADIALRRAARWMSGVVGSSYELLPKEEPRIPDDEYY